MENAVQEPTSQEIAIDAARGRAITKPSAAMWFNSNEVVPRNISKEEWTQWLEYACRNHRHMAWRVAELIAFGLDRWSESYFTLIEFTGYERSYVEKIEGWVRRGLTVTRRKLVDKHQDCETIPHSWFEAVAPLKDDNGFGWDHPAAKQEEILKARMNLLLSGWHYTKEPVGMGDGWLHMETETFKALVLEYRKTKGELPPEKEKEPVSKTDSDEIINAEFKDDDGITVHLSSDAKRKLEVFAAYFGKTDCTNAEIIEHALGQLYTIRRKALKKYE